MQKLKQKQNLLKALKQLKTAQREGGCPDHMWHPDYGWIIYRGRPTASGKLFAKSLEKEIKCSKRKKYY